jgi:hypothetical protein
VEWRIQRSGFKGDKPWALVLAYVTNRAIQDRLDAVCGPENWQNEYKPAPSGEGVLCGIGVKLDGGWVWKWDGAENTNFEAIKGGLSGSMKRAAVQWGIGRYLYDLEAGFANFTDDGAHRDKIKDEKSGREEWLKWNPPQLPYWALPGSGGKNPAAPPLDPNVPPLEVEFKKEDALFLRDLLLSYLEKVQDTVGRERAEKLRAAMRKNEDTGQWKRFADWITGAHEALKAEVERQEGVLAANTTPPKNELDKALGALGKTVGEKSGERATAQGEIVYDHE